MHSHHYAFNIQKEKFLRKTFIRTTRHYNKKGVLQKCDSLAPPEQGYYYEKYYSSNGRISREVAYKPRRTNGGYTSNTSQQRRDFVKIKEYSIDNSGKKTVVYELTEPVKYFVEKAGDEFRFMNKLYEDNLIDHVNAKYATFEDKKRYMEVRIKDASSDSILSILKFDYSNGLLNTNEPAAVRKFIVRTTTVFIDIPRLIFFDNSKPNETTILDYHFKKIIKASLREVLVLKPVSTQDYYLWICNEKCGLYDLNGKNIIPPNHDVVYGGGGDFLKITTDHQHACFDYRGNVIIPYNEDYGAFDLSDANIAHIYNSDYSPTGEGVSYVNLVTRDTIKKAISGLPFHGDFATVSEGRKKGVIDKKGEWVVKPDLRINGIEIGPDSLLFIELKNPKFYDLAGSDRKYWHQKYILQIAESLQEKTDLLVRHPDFDPREYIYVLYNIKTKKSDTVNINSKALDGIHSYSLSIESHDNKFVNGYAKLKISGHGKSINWFYTFLSRDGSVVNVQDRYDEVRNMSPTGSAIVTKKKTVNGSRTIEVEGIISASGKEIVPCEFLSCWENKYGFMVNSRTEGRGLIDFDGEILIPPSKNYATTESIIVRSINPFISFDVD
jgi:hypothetical protein